MRSSMPMPTRSSRCDARGRQAPPQGLRPVCLAIGLLLGAPAAWPLPQGARTTFGDVTVGAPSGGGMVIRQGSDKAGLNWTSFSIASGEWVRVDQPTSHSVLLNRVLGNDPSIIFGRLQSNGQVFLSNPRGIIFGRGSEIDVGGLVATTLEMNDVGQGRYQLTQGTQAPGTLTAQGRITSGGTVAMVAPTLVQEGSITAHRVGLAAGGSVLVDVDGDGMVFFNLRDQGLDGRLSHSGQIVADGGSAELRAAARAGVAGNVLNLDGVVQARSLGLQNGSIVVDGGTAGITRIAGSVDATGDAAATRGGEVTVLGEKILLDTTARLDASGRGGGGEVLVGGDFQGQGLLPHARMTYIADGATLDAGARDNGLGGNIVVWSDEATRFFGSVSANGGALGGDGGRIEVSGKHYLDFRGRFSALAPRGRAGSLLLDPDDININNNADANETGAGSDADPFVALNTNATANLKWATIQGALNSGNVTVQTSNGGDITVTQSPSAALTGANRLTLDSDNNIAIQQAITRSGAGDLVLLAVNAVTLGANITTVGGDVTITAGNGITQSAGSISTGAGLISMDGGDAAVTLSGSLSSTSNAANAISIFGATTLQIGNLAAGATGGISLTHSGAGTQAAATAITSGKLTKAGAGTLTLARTNTYTGGTLVSAGTLALAGGAALSNTGVVQVNTGATLQLSSSETIGDLAGSGSVALGANTLTTGGTTNNTFSGVINGTGALVKQGSGVFTLSGTNTYTGGTTVSAGSLALSGGTTLADAGALTVNGGTLNLSAGSETVGAVTLSSGSISNGSLVSNTSYAVQGGSAGANLQGTAALAKTGAGTATLSGTNTYSGGTTVTAGTLAVSGGAALADTGAVTVNGGTLSLSAGSETVGAVTMFSGSITSGTLVSNTSYAVQGGSAGANLQGTAALVKTGGGTATLSGTNTYSGGTTVSAGTLAVSGGAALIDSGAVTVSGGALDLGAGSETVGALLLSSGAISNGTLLSNTSYTMQSGTVSAGLQGTAALNKQGNTTVTLSGTNTYSGDTTVTAGTLAVSGGAALRDTGAVTVDTGATLQLTSSETIGSLAGAGAVSLGANTLNTGASNANTTFSGAIGGSGGLVKQGSGIFTLSGSNTYTGGTTVSAGTLALSGGTVLADAGALTVSGGALDLGAGSETVDAVTLISGSISNGSLVSNTSYDVQGGSASANLQGTAALAKTGANIATLSGTNTYSGGTTVTAGTLAVFGGAALADTGAVTVNGGTLSLSAGTETVGAVTLSSGSITSGTLVSNTSFTVQGGAASANLQGTAALAKTGTGSATLSGTNSYSGGTTVTAGTLAVSGGNALIDTGAVTVNGGTLNLSGSSETVGAVILASGSIANGTLTSNADYTLQSGAISASLQGAVAVNKQGAGTVTLSGANGYSGATNINAGTLAISGGAALPDASAVTVNGGTLDLSAGSETVGALALASGSINNGTLTSLTDYVLQSGTVSAGLQGGVALNKQTAGTVTLSGPNGYTGGTVVNDGTLIVSGGAALIDTGAVVVNPGATLQLGSNETIGSLAGAGNVALGTSTLSTGVSNTDTVFAGSLGGAGALVKQGSGIFTLSGSNVHTGGSTVNAGTLAVSGGAALADSGPVNVNGGTLDLSGGSETVGAVTLTSGSIGNGTLVSDVSYTMLSGTATANLQGAAALSKQGAGTVTLSGLNTYSGGTTVSAGTLSVSGGAALADAGAVIVSGGTLDLSAGSETVGAVTLTSGSVANGTLISDASYTVQAGTAGANLQGTAALSKTGAGSATLSGTNTYSGGTTVSAGTLTVSGGAALADTGSLAINGGTLDLGGGSETVGAVTFAGGTASNGNLVSDIGFTAFSGSASANLQGLGGLSKQGTGSFSMNGSNTYSGGTTIEDGTLIISGGFALLDTGPLILNGGVLDLSGSSETVGDLTFNGGSVINGDLQSDGNLTVISGSTSANLKGPGSLTKQGLGTFTLSGNNTYLGGTFITGGTLVASGGRALPDPGAVSIDAGATLRLNSSETIGSLTGAGAVVLGANTLSNGVNNTDTVFVGSISGTGALIKLGSGIFTLSGLNIYTGGTTVSAGTLTLGGGSALADTGAVIVNGGTLDLGAGSETVGAVTLNNGSIVDGSLVSASGFTVKNGSASAQLAGTGVLAKQGSGTVTLSGANTYSGATTVSAGTLVLSGGAALSDTNAVSVSALGTLSLLNNEAIGSLAGAGVVALDVNTLTVGASNANSTFSGVLGGSGGLVKTGAGQLTLSGSNTFSGGATVQGGTLALAGGNALIDAGAVNVAGGTLSLVNSETIGSLAGAGAVALGANTLTTGSTSSTFVGAIGGTGALVKQGAGVFTLSGANTYSGGTTLNQGTLALAGGAALADSGAVTVNGGTLDLSAGSETVGAVTLNNGSIVDGSLASASGFSVNAGSISAQLTGTGGLTKQGSGTVTLSGANIYSGATAVNAGTLLLAGGSALADTNAVSVSAPGTVTLVNDEAIGSLAGAGAVALGASTLTVGGSNSNTNFSGAIGGSGQLVKNGSGQLTLSGTNSFSGGTTVQAGTLAVAGGSALIDTGAVAIAGGTFSLSGGNETVGAVTLQSGSINDGTLVSQAGYAVQSGSIGANLQGGAALTKLGNGAVTLSGSNVYSGGTTVQGGSLRVSGGNALPDAGSVVLADVAGASLQLLADESIGSLAGGGAAGGGVGLANHTLNMGGSGASSSFSGVIDGAGGAITKSGAGTLTLLGSNTYSGFTTIDGGVLQIGNGGAAGTLGSGAVIDNATLRFDRSDETVVANAISGSGALDQAGSNTLALTGANSYQGPTIIRAGGTLQVGNGGSAGTLGSGAVNDAGTLRVLRAGQLVLGNTITGAGGFEQAGPGTTVFTGNNSYSGTTTVSAGVLQIGQGGAAATTGSLGSGAVVDNATLRFDRSDAVTVANPISGSGSLEQAGSGVLTLANAANSYAGSTHVIDGTLATSGAERLPDASAVIIDAGAQLDLHGAETVASIDANGAVTLRGNLTTAGDQRYGAALILDGAIALSGHDISAVSDDNQLGTAALVVNANQLTLSSGKSGAVHRDLNLGALTLAQGGRIDAGTLNLQGNVNLAGGSLALNSDAAVAACSGNGLCGEDTRVGLTTTTVLDAFGNVLRVAADAVQQSSGQITVADGATLQVSTAGGSVGLTQAANSFIGGVSVTTGGAAAEGVPVARVNLAGVDVNVANIDSELVRIRADRLSTLDQGVITARYAFSDTIGTAQQLPGLLLELGPASFDGGGGAFGTLDRGIAVNVGFAAANGPTGGYITIRPKSAQDAQATAALVNKGASVFLTGPAASPVPGGYVFFYDGAKLVTEVPVWYNGFRPQTPEAEGALSAVASVSEAARRDRFEETVRTENVAVRLRSGVIAEVGPGRPATEGARGATPPTLCDVGASGLQCAAETAGR